MDKVLSEEKSLIKNNKSVNKFIDLFIKIFAVFMALLLIILSLFSFIFTAYFNNKYYEYSEQIFYKYDNIVLNFLGVALFLGVIWFVYKLFKKIKIKYLELALFIFMIIIGISFVIYFKVPPKADQECIVYGAEEFLKGNFDLLDKTGYMGIHPLQIGITLFVEIIFKLFNSTNAIIVQLFNVVFSAICIFFICKITNHIFEDEKISKILIILLFGFFELIFFNTHVYGNIVGLMFSLIAIFFTIKFLNEKKWYYILIISLSMAFSVILKSNYKIFMIGIILVLIIDFIKKMRKEQIICIFSILVTVFVFEKLLMYAIERYSGKAVSSGIPMVSYIYMGIQESEQPGWYTGYVVSSYSDNNYDVESTAKYSKEKIMNRLKDMIKEPSQTIQFFMDKIRSTWNEPTYQTIWINKPSEVITEEIMEYVEGRPLIKSYYDGTLGKVLERYFDYFQITIYLFSGISIIYSFKNMNLKKILIPVIVFGGFLFHLIWETKSIYVLTYYILLLPYAAEGMYLLYNKVKFKLNSKKIKMEEI